MRYMVKIALPSLSLFVNPRGYRMYHPVSYGRCGTPRPQPLDTLLYLGPRSVPLRIADEGYFCVLLQGRYPRPYGVYVRIEAVYHASQDSVTR